MPRFIHRDIEFYNGLCKLFPSFDKRFQEECKKRMHDSLDYIEISEIESKANFSWKIKIPKSDISIKIIEKYAWHNVADFDGNPNNYVCVQKFKYSNYSVEEQMRIIHPLCREFMYIDPPN